MDNKSERQPRKLDVRDAHVDDEKIPRNLILMYGSTPYVTKAGLEFKANKLFGGAGYSIQTEIIENDREKQYCLVKTKLTVLANGAIYENYGEAHTGNVNSRMLSQLLHLAITRAECRVLRMATATAYASYDEVATIPDFSDKQLTPPEDEEPATEAQIAVIKKLTPKANVKDLSRGAAKELIKEGAKYAVANRIRK